MGQWEAYAAKRKHYNYYQTVRRMICMHSCGGTIIDVGNGGTDVVTYGSFARRIAINAEPIEERKGIELIIGRWPHVELPVETADVIVCCQVLEHLADEELPPFVERLFAVGKVAVVSVPYKWPAGSCAHHIQDPIDEAKLQAMLGRELQSVEIVGDEGVHRMVTCVNGNPSSH